MSAPTITRPAPSAVITTRPRPGVARRVLATLTILIGLTFVAMTLIVNLFSVGPAFERLTDGFRPVMTQQSIATAKADVAQLTATSDEFQTRILPALATQLNMTPAQLTDMMGNQFPDVAVGLGSLPTIAPNFSRLLATLDQQRPYFTSADAIPTKNLPATTLPWGLLVAGVVVTGLGVYMWFAPPAGAIVTLVVGAALVVTPLVMSLPQKASDADQLNANLKPVYTQSLITQSDRALATLGAMGTQMQTKMMPALAAQLKMTPAQLQAYFAGNFPTTTGTLASMPTTMQRFQNLVATFRAHLSDYKTLKPVQLAPIVWVMVGGAIGLVLIGGTGVWMTRRTEGVDF